MTNADEGLLYSIVVTLLPTAEATVRATMGAQVHAAFLDTVQEADPALADMLHAGGQAQRPFTVSPLRGLPRAREGQIALSPERPCWLRFTVLRPAVAERFMDRFLRADRPALRIGRAELLIREILVTPGRHPWAGYARWEDLTDGAAAEEVTLEFVTPTAFSFGRRGWGRKVVVLPLPDLVFGSLARSWNAWAPAGLRLDREVLRAYLENDVVVKEIGRLETRMLRYSRAPQIGFVGRVTYGLMGTDAGPRRHLTTLADYAFYAGVGYKTTMGMGQVRRVRQEGGQDADR